MMGLVDVNRHLRKNGCVLHGRVLSDLQVSVSEGLMYNMNASCVALFLVFYMSWRLKDMYNMNVFYVASTVFSTGVGERN